MTPDSSVVIAAFSPWQEGHAVAVEAIRGLDDIVAHTELEAYSILTRLPPPFDLEPAMVVDGLARQFSGRRLVLGASARTSFVRRLQSSGIVGGAAYDGLIAATAAEHELTLITRDRRAAGTYRRIGAPYELIG